MILLLLLVLVLGGQDVSSSFHLPGKKTHTHYYSATDISHQQQRYGMNIKRDTTASRSTALKVLSGGGDVVDVDVDDDVNGEDKAHKRFAYEGIKLSIIVGVITSTMGFFFDLVGEEETNIKSLYEQQFPLLETFLGQDVVEIIEIELSISIHIVLAYDITKFIIRDLVTDLVSNGSHVGKRDFTSLIGIEKGKNSFQLISGGVLGKSCGQKLVELVEFKGTGTILIKVLNVFGSFSTFGIVTEGSHGFEHFSNGDFTGPILVE